MSRKSKRGRHNRWMVDSEKIPHLAIHLADAIADSKRFISILRIEDWNLLCAEGLPRAASIDRVKIRKWIENAAYTVDFETRRHWYRFERSPETYHNSPGFFRCYFLLQVLQEDFRVRYNPARVRDPSFQDPKCHAPDFSDSRDLFIHGIIDGEGGTCASMPVLYVAVARRLGYPLRLVEARGHLFFRWDDPVGVHSGSPESVNIEGAGHGISSFPDDYYRSWPEPWSPAEHAAGCYLKSLGPTEEIAAFLSTRGECLECIGELTGAIQSYEWVCRLLPSDRRYAWRLATLRARQDVGIERMANPIALFGAVRRPSVSQFAQLAFGATPMPHSPNCLCAICAQAQNRKLQQYQR